jgi:putative NADH-flavin reductase
MKVMILGATGGTGKHAVERALAAGHEVTALVRKPESVTTQHERLRLVKGDVLRAESVAEAVMEQQAVLSAFGPADNSKPGTLISEGIRNLVQAMTQANVRRLVFESGLMVGTPASMGPIKRGMVAAYRAMYRALYDDKVIAEKSILESTLDWTIVRPPSLKHAPARGNYNVGTDIDIGVAGGVAHADVADMMVKALDQKELTKQIVYISY